MLSFRQFVRLDEMTVFRGVTGKFDHSYSNKQSIVWVSTSKEHSEMYTSGDGELVEFELNTSRMKPVDLGFRSSETPVKFDEVRSRFKKRLMDLFKRKELNREDAMSIIDGMDKVDGKGHRPVYEWLQVPDVIDMIKQAGFNAIRLNEGMTAHAGDVTTYGILDKSLIKTR